MLAQDPRTQATVTWTEPDAGDLGPLQSFEVRKSASAPGSDLESWWSGASTVGSPPSPAGAGIRHALVLSGLTPGQTIYTAVRARDTNGNLSAMAQPRALSTYGGPLLHGVTPVLISAEGAVDFTVRGLGISASSTVRLQRPGGSWVTGAILAQNPDGSLRVRADVTTAGNGTVNLEVTHGGLTDRLDGWITVNVPPPPPDTTPPGAITNLNGSAQSETSVRLTWTAPGDPSETGAVRVTGYEVRRLAGSPGAWTWAGGTSVGAPAPATPGSFESMTVTGLTPGLTAAFAVKSVDAAGNWSGESNVVQVTLPLVDTLPPAPVNDLTGTFLNDTTIRLSWTAPSDPGPTGPGRADLYDLRRLGGSPGSWSWETGTSLGASAPGQPGETDTRDLDGFTPGSVVAFAIRSRDAAGNWSPVSNVVSLQIPDPTPPDDDLGPAAITDFTAGAETPQSVRLTWTAPSDLVQAGATPSGVTAYELRRLAGSPGAWTWIGGTVVGTAAPAAPGNAESMLITALTPGSTVAYAIRSRDANGNWSLLSPFAEVTLPYPPDAAGPTAVADLGATELSPGAVRLTWTAPVDPAPWGNGSAEGFELRHMSGTAGAWSWGTAGVVASGASVASGLVQTVDLDGLAAGDNHRFAVKTRDAAGNWSDASAVVSISLAPEPDNAPPAAVNDLAGSALSPVSVSLTWTAPFDVAPEGTGRVSQYELRRLGGGPGAWSWESGTSLGVPAPGWPGQTDALTVTGLTPESLVAFAIRSRDSNGNLSPLSNIATVTLPAWPDTTGPETIVDLAATLDSNDLVVLTWTAPADEQGTVTGYALRTWDGEPAAFDWNAATPQSPPGSVEAPGSVSSWFAGLVEPGSVRTYALRAVDDAGNWSAVSPPAILDRRDEDIEAPAMPGDLEASRLDTNALQLRWRAPGDDGESGRASAYELRAVPSPNLGGPWWDGAPAEMLSQKPRPSGKLEFHNLKDLEGGQVYGVALRALDEAGNMSAWATVLLFVDGPTGTADTSPPTAPSVLTGQRVGTDVHLVWTASPDADVVAYRVFRHQGNGLRLLQEITGTEFWDTSAPKSTARYTVSAVDAAGNESRTGASVEVGPESTALRFDPEGRGGTLSWSSSEAASVPTVQVFDVRGRLIADLVAMEDAMGWRASWSGDTLSGPARAGVYFVRVRQRQLLLSHKVVITH